MIIGLVVGGIFGMIGGMIGEPILGLVVGLYIGLAGGLFFGGRAVIQHFTLRFVLSCKGLFPWRLVSFLDYAAERIFLRKVGGGYVFVHRMLMYYFADLPGPEEP